MIKKSFDRFLYNIFLSKKKEEKIIYKDELPKNIRNLINKIDLILTNNDIQYVIPFTHKKYNDFRHLKIIISNLFTPQLVIDLFEHKGYKLEKEFIDIYIDDILVTFILTPVDDFNITFWYYSWDILPTLMNVLLDPFGIKFEKDGLKYTFKGNYRLTKRIDEIIEFLGLNFKQFKSGFFTLENEIDYIMNSPSFNANLFFKYQLNPKDHFYDDNLVMFKKCLDIYEPFKNSTGNFVFSEDKGVYLSFIVEFFPDSGLIEKLTGQKNNI